MIDTRGCEALSKGELREFMMFMHESVYMNETKFEYNSKTKKSESNFDNEQFDGMYDSLEKITIAVKAADSHRIINRLGEDVYEGVSTTANGTRYEERVQFNTVWEKLKVELRRDGVMFRLFGEP
jgi:hypothetical protein